MNDDWTLHYARWVIEDGQPDRDVGEIFDWFALTFWSDEKLSAAYEHKRLAVPVGDNQYRVVAEVTYLSDNICVIDFGLKATSDGDLLPPGCTQGNFVTGEIYLNLPLCTEVVPDEVLKALVYKWKVNRILADMTPYVPCPDNPRFLVRDSSRIRYEEVVSTDSVRASGYILHCSKIPRKTD
jgi:hypothetical protein